MNYSQALNLLMAGKAVQRAGWNGKGMFIFRVPGSTFKANREPLLSLLGEGTEVTYRGHIDMRAADGTIAPWLCSQTDMQAEDWTEVTVEKGVVQNVVLPKSHFVTATLTGDDGTEHEMFHLPVESEKDARILFEGFSHNIPDSVQLSVRYTTVVAGEKMVVLSRSVR